MSPTSTSNSSAPLADTKFRVVDADDTPRVTFSWTRWVMIPVLVVCAEFGARAVMSLDIIETPFLYGNHHITQKVLTFENDFLPKESGGERYLIMGSSMPNTNIDPVILTQKMEEATGRDWSGFNGAFYAGRYDDMYFFMQWYYERWPYDHLIMTIEPWSLRPYRFEQLQERLSKPKFERWLMEHSALFMIRNQWIWYDETRTTRTRGLELLDQMHTEQGWVRTLPHFRSKNLDQRAKEQADDMLDQTLDPPRVYEHLSYEMIPKVQQWAAEHHVTVWWIISPTSPPLEKHMLSQFKYEELRELGEKIASEPGNYLMDIKDLEFNGVLKDEHYFDSNHLLPHGAVIFSNVLGERWAEYYKHLVEQGMLKPKE